MLTLLLILATGPGTPPPTKDVYYERVIRENYYDSTTGRHVFTQLLYSNWDEKGHYIVHGFILVDPRHYKLVARPFHTPLGVLFLPAPERELVKHPDYTVSNGVLTMCKNNVILRIHHDVYVERWTTADTDLVNREYFPKDKRKEIKFGNPTPAQRVVMPPNGTGNPVEQATP